MTWALARGPLPSLREGGISGHEDIEMLKTCPQLGSVGLGQGGQLKSTPWGPVCSWENNYGAEASSAERSQVTDVC